MMNASTRNPNTVMQTGANQLAIAAPLAALLGWYLSTKGVPPEASAAATAASMGILSIVGTALRNVVSAGWAKYVG